MKRVITFAACLLLVAAVTCGHKNKKPSWVARYDGPENGRDRAYSLALDNSGNVYVTGESRGSGINFDYATVKYDSLGNELWVARYDGPGNEEDRAYSIAVDNSGNAYVTGGSKGSGANLDYATIKYDSRGNQLWVARYDGPGNEEDRAYSIAVDNSGNVYVTGESRGSGINFDYATVKYDSLVSYLKKIDYATVKYDSLGNELWVARYDAPGNGWDRPNSIAADNSGNVYVTGGSKGSGTNLDYATIKYDSRGNELWVARYDGPGSGWDIAYSLALDNSGNVYVTGGSKGSGANLDYATIKYDSRGNELWVVRYDGPGSGWDIAYSLALDNSGNVYVTGGSKGSVANMDYATIKYDSRGNELWVTRYDGPGIISLDRAYSLALDNSGNVYVTGCNQRFLSKNSDYATVKYDSLGNELWVARYDGPVNEEDRAYSLALDNSGNVYVTGCSKGSALLGTDFDYATVKYDSLGNELWVARYDGPGNEKDRAYSLALDDSGNVYVTGGSKGSGANMDYATIKYDSRGNQLWVARYDGPGSAWDRAYSLALDDSGNVYVTGGSKGSGANMDYATIKYDSRGNQLWVARYDGPGNAWDRIYSLALDNSGNVYVTGGSKGSGANMDYATIKYDSRGNELWVVRYDGPGSGWDIAYSLALDNSSNVYVTGESVGSGINSDYATVKYDSLGNELWVTRYDGPGIISLDRAYSLALDNSGNVYVTGCNQRFLSKNSDYATVKYDSLGNELWVARYDAPGNGWDRPNSIAADNSGNVYVTGCSNKGSGTNMDYATIKYGPDGQ